MGSGACLQPRDLWRWLCSHSVPLHLSSQLLFVFLLRLPARAGPNARMNFTVKTKSSWSCWSFLIPSVPPCSQGRKLT